MDISPFDISPFDICLLDFCPLDTLENFHLGHVLFRQGCTLLAWPHLGVKAGFPWSRSERKGREAAFSASDSKSSVTIVAIFPHGLVDVDEVLCS